MCTFIVMHSLSLSFYIQNRSQWHRFRNSLEVLCFFFVFLGQQHLLLCVERWTLVGFVLHSPANAGLEFNQVAQSMYWTASLRGVFCSIHCPAADIRVAHGVQKLLGG